MNTTITPCSLFYDFLKSLYYVGMSEREDDCNVWITIMRKDVVVYYRLGCHTQLVPFLILDCWANNVTEIINNELQSMGYKRMA